MIQRVETLNLNLAPPRVGFMFLHEWHSLPLVTDYTTLPRTQGQVRRIPNFRSAAFDKDHTWTAISNPWIDPSSEQAVLRVVPTPSIPLKNPDLCGATIKLAEWLTSPLATPESAPSRAEPSPLLPAPLPITLRQFYAAHAMQGLLASLASETRNQAVTEYSESLGITVTRHTVSCAFSIADDMIAHELKDLPPRS